MSISAQEIIDLPHEESSEFEYIGGENEYFSEVWSTEVVSNISMPTMEVFQPAPGKSTGTSVIIAPGGGMYALSINSEGNDVAKWLNTKGITAFVLKYRLVPYQGDATAAFSKPGENAAQKAKNVLPTAVQDGLNAIDHVRTNTKKYNLDPNKIGFMGFSAGGAVTMGVTLTADQESKPNFIVPVYPWMSIVDDYTVPSDAPPMLVICASDDPLGLAPMSIELHSNWLKSEIATGLHMYSKGGHGFGMKKLGFASDKWIERCYEWMLDERLTK